MKKLIPHLQWLLLVCISFSSLNTKAQVVGRLFDQSRNTAYDVYMNGFVQQLGNPGNAGYMAVDPTGFHFRRLPSTTPFLNAFFISWNNQLVEVNAATGARVIGYCDCPNPINPNPIVFNPPHYNQNIGIGFNGGIRPIPTELIDPNKPYGNIMITTEAKAKSCYQSSQDKYGNLDQEKFGLCMINAMAGKKELALLNCIREAETTEEQILCLMGELGGENEKRITKQIAACFKTYGSEWSKYPLCMSAANNQNGEVSKILACMEQQSRTGEVTFMGTAICYGVSGLKLNPETQIIVECAIASGGDPYVFAGCAGGQLLARELDKCLENGIGGEKGCFGVNNDVVKGLKQVAELLQIRYGQNNEIVKAWNKSIKDLLGGPSEKNDAVKAIRNIGNTVGKAADDVGSTIKKSVPRITL
jgi:hypothetical protein